MPAPGQLPQLSANAREAFTTAARRCEAALGAELVEIELDPFLAAGRLLYEGAFVAERYAAVGEFIARHREQVDPTVGAIILAGGAIRAADYVADLRRLDRLRAAAEATLVDCDALVMPTAPWQPAIEEVTADPVGSNQRLGIYTTFANLLDLCALALPAGQADGGEFGVTLLGTAGRDATLTALAGELGGVLGSCDPVPHGDQAGPVDGGP